MTRSTFTLLAAGALTVIALSGCSAASTATSPTPSATPSVSAQTTAESCQILQDAVSDSASELQSAYGQITTDPAAAAEKIQALADALDDGSTKVSDKDVKAAAEHARDSVTSMVDILKTGIADPTKMDTAALQTAVTAVQTDFGAIGELCG